ncbi:D-2-hydroxyacid dehydrogenase [Gulosibacter sp. ACHW.36C]|uniref:D-2-hydroxyacid dehydrogenase n=1 Tax=Gulosibacter sediminis TaxID=1729695 RepID=A0ABY4N0G4_9MICO|nr:D-2-hydroxyacid dehydrogenase [Gulosibacter sediminis]UQN15116.1 D-2-hydroxyacid dehydrogenase [Gulosibacter sediminis]
MKPMVLVAVADAAEPPPELARLERDLTPHYVSTPEEYRAVLADAKVLLVWDLQTKLVHECGPGKVEWIHTNSLGVNAVATAEVADSVTVTNTQGLFEQPMAEFVLASILYRAKGLDRLLAHQRGKVWDQQPTSRIAGRRALVVGAGGVGRTIAELLRATGIDVAIIGRTRREEPDARGGTRVVHGIDELHELLPGADDIVLAAPLTEATRGLIGLAELALMKQSAHLINVGRGGLVDEAALIDALRCGAPAAATLDVFAQEPLPPESPLWEMEQVLVSPHQSADTIGWRDAAVELFLENYARHRAGEPLSNVVNVGALRVDG